MGESIGYPSINLGNPVVQIFKHDAGETADLVVAASKVARGSGERTGLWYS
ncbi:hypothetical protein CCP3SC5AM1_210024 [Gammaproteobacteria bacterium]